MFRPLISLAFLATLTGCVSTPYVEPTGENVSTIKFHNQGRGNAEVYIYKEAAQCTGKQKAAEVEKMAYKNVTVLSDIPHSFSFGFGFSDYVSHKSCSITGTFTPKAKTDYEVLIVSSYGGCVVYLYEIQDGQKVPAQGEQKEYSAPVAGDSWCK
ncbi:TPA: hypothetical protein ACGUVV_005302 [Vibrio vulnificus]|uniref:hypothetical protein n=1 Tax=Vibrio vulnificus TaxID=672 RepID=UPI00102A5BE9|nr:hypothetical protein [Vibrio vulnificus]EGR0104625.1 hypothetical protein [Vibrio vulnificus]EGR0107228.1 hypothetical protein [Vibrio vulnificus]EKZ9199840.1 hypothetical protein [Vibrio vulnificus]EKZ9203594.1 hypothetical protein [Vibrio vulnificus]ELV8742183.1 hypothetical protein [Vibrio vulnificus]